MNRLQHLMFSTGYSGTMKHTLPFLFLVLAACNGDAVTSDREAEIAAAGLEGALARGLHLGFEGFQAADSANIPTQSEAGDLAGLLTVDGQVDQGASANKGMRLDVHLVDYADLEELGETEEDIVGLTYDTAEDAPLAYDLQLRGIPDGTLEGSIQGDVLLDGPLGGVVTLDLTLSGTLVPAGDSATVEDGTTAVMGTVTNDGGGVYDVDILL